METKLPYLECLSDSGQFLLKLIIFRPGEIFQTSNENSKDFERFEH